jgi:hypothetical protein
MAEEFIAGAVKRPGALTARAKAAGMTVDAYASAHRNDKGLAGQQSRFYLDVLKPASSKARTPRVAPTSSKARSQPAPAAAARRPSRDRKTRSTSASVSDAAYARYVRKFS